MTGHRTLILLSATALVLAACGGGDDDSSSDVTAAPTTEAATTAPTTAPPTTAAPSTAPPTTAASTTAPPTTEAPSAAPVLGDVLVAEDGFLTMQIIQGWNVDNLLPDPELTIEDVQGLAWEPSLGSIIEMVAISSPDGNVDFRVVREGRYGLAPDVFEWDAEFSALLEIQPNVDVSIGWGGGEGESTRGTLTSLWVRHDSVQVGEHLVSVLAAMHVEPTDEMHEAIDLMINSIMIDPSALPSLIHALDTTVSTEVDDPGTTLSVSILTPPNWIEPEDATDIIWLDPDAAIDGPIPNIVHRIYVNESPIEVFLDEQLAEYQVLTSVPVFEDLGDIGGAFVRVAWDGAPGEAENAAVAISDGVLDHFVSITVPGDPATLVEMINSILILDSALL